MNKTLIELINFTGKKENKIIIADLTYLERGINQNTNILVFYRIPEVYKKKIHILLRLVVLVIRSL